MLNPYSSQYQHHGGHALQRFASLIELPVGYDATTSVYVYTDAYTCMTRVMLFRCAHVPYSFACTRDVVFVLRFVLKGDATSQTHCAAVMCAPRYMRRSLTPRFLCLLIDIFLFLLRGTWHGLLLLVFPMPGHYNKARVEPVESWVLIIEDTHAQSLKFDELNATAH